jgi:hypothetical protein
MDGLKIENWTNPEYNSFLELLKKAVLLFHGVRRYRESRKPT